MKHIKQFEEFNEQEISSYELPSAPKSNLRKDYKRTRWMHDIDKETGDITLTKPYGVKNADARMDFGLGKGVFKNNK